MLNRPSLDELMKKADSRYSLVVASAKRARALTEQNEQGVVGSTAKPVTQALEEIAANRVRFRPSKRGPKQQARS
ncbi:MAG: DNA-directed RNA polymerase subunit omega [Candidatus Desulforudis sp.]|nr:DNA-directed RNA polymerase subunit omega [Desulforudis sp.]